MDIKQLEELLTFTYERTTKDNAEDLTRVMICISKLCTYLAAKGIITKDEMQEILKVEDTNGSTTI